jgi:hypothetical protein
MIPVLMLAPLPLSAKPLTFTVNGEIDVDVVAPLAANEEVWCHLWLRAGPSSADLELAHLKANLVAANRYVCKPSIFFRWGDPGAYKKSGANLVYGAYVVNSTSKDPQPGNIGGDRRTTQIGPSLYPPPALKTVTKLPAVNLEL